MTVLQRLTEHPAATALPPFHTERVVKWRLNIPTNNTTATLQPLNERKPAPEAHRTSGVQPALAADHAAYVLGFSDQKISPARAEKYRAAFTDLLNRFATSGDPAARVAADWFTSGNSNTITAPENASARDLITVAVDGHDLIDNPTTRDYWLRTIAETKGTGREDTCLVCGNHGPLMASIPTTVPAHLLPGGTKPISFLGNNMQVAQYGVNSTPGLQSTPICVTCSDRVMSGLLAALNVNNRSIHVSGQDTRHCWWYTGTAPETDWIHTALQGPAATPDTLDQLRRARGTCPPDTRVCSLMLNAASGARASIQHWVDQPLHDVLDNLVLWWEQAEIANVGSDTNTIPTISAMVLACGTFDAKTQRYDTPGMSSDRRDPWTYRKLAQAALEGRPTPPDIMGSVLKRLSGDSHVGNTRAALLRSAQPA